MMPSHHSVSPVFTCRQALECSTGAASGIRVFCCMFHVEKLPLILRTARLPIHRRLDTFEESSLDLLSFGPQVGLDRIVTRLTAGWRDRLRCDGGHRKNTPYACEHRHTKPIHENTSATDREPYERQTIPVWRTPRRVLPGSRAYTVPRRTTQVGTKVTVQNHGRYPLASLRCSNTSVHSANRD